MISIKLNYPERKRKKTRKKRKRKQVNLLKKTPAPPNQKQPAPLTDASNRYTSNRAMYVYTPYNYNTSNRYTSNRAIYV